MARKAIKVRCIETNEVYNSYREAGMAIGVNQNSVRRVVLGTQESVKGLHFEAVEEEEVEEEEQMITSITNEQGETVPVIDSREVARMMGKKHCEILQYLEGRVGGNSVVIGIIPTLETEYIQLQKYFIPSAYKAGKKEYKCYLCTKMGCELLANKMKGEKGILFSAKYVERFNEMEKELKNNNNPSLAKEDELILAVVKGATSLDRVTALQEYTALITDKATAPLKAELTQAKAELTDKTEFIDDVNDCFTFTEVKQYNKQLLRDRKDIVLSTAELNRVAAELGIPVNKIDNPIEYSPYRRVNAYPRKVWEKAYPDIKLPEKESKKLPEKKENK